MRSILVPKGLKLTQLQALRNHNATGVTPDCCGPHPPPMLLMLGLLLSWVLMLHDADMLLVRKIRVVLARHRPFLPVCFGQS